LLHVIFIEKLPFAYFFDDTFDSNQLIRSFGKVLNQFPTAGGRLFKSLHIRCSPEDNVPISFADTDMTMQKWLSVSRGHHHQSGNGHHPNLLPIFDPLFHSDLEGNEKLQNDDIISGSFDTLLTARITRFANNSGTVLGINTNHLLGDTASCVRFAECWGLAHQHRSFGAPSLDRTPLSCTGMMNEKLVDILGHGLGGDETDNKKTSSWHGFFFDSRHEDLEKEIALIDHEYVKLPFTEDVLDAMKAHGMESCRTTKGEKNIPSFISRNDMIMAAAWLLKRLLANAPSSHLSIVMNLRGRCGVEDFNYAENDDNSPNKNMKNGLFGNGIVNVFAKVKPSLLKESNSICVSHVSRAARAIRMALIEGQEEIPSRLNQSKLGKPLSSTTKPISSTSSSFFSITSWRQISPHNISFSSLSSTVVNFHGQPAHPIPKGKTYTSVVHENFDGGSTVDLFLPSDQSQQAIKLHEDLCNLFLLWREESINRENNMSIKGTRCGA